MNNIAEIVAIDWVGSGLSAASHPLFGELQTVYETVFERVVHNMLDMQPSQILTASGNALAELSVDVLRLDGRRAQNAEVLGITHPDFDRNQQEVHKILEFVCIETLKRYYQALKEVGYDAKNIDDDIQRVRSGEIKGIENLAKLSNKYERHVMDIIKIGQVRPLGGWASLRLDDPPKVELDRPNFGYL